jgi:hypothetical protein
MTITHLLAGIGGIAIVLAAAARLPTAAAEVLRACVSLVDSLHALRRAWRRPDPDVAPDEPPSRR